MDSVLRIVEDSLRKDGENVLLLFRILFPSPPTSSLLETRRLEEEGPVFVHGTERGSTGYSVRLKGLGRRLDVDGTLFPWVKNSSPTYK